MYAKVPSQPSSVSSTPLASPRSMNSWAPTLPMPAPSQTIPPPFQPPPIYDNDDGGSTTSSSRSSGSHSHSHSGQGPAGPLSWQQRLLRDPPALPGSGPGNGDFKSRHLHRGSTDSSATSATKMFPLIRAHTSTITTTGETVSPPFTPRHPISNFDYADDATSVSSEFTTASSVSSWHRPSLGAPLVARTPGPIHRAQTSNLFRSSSGNLTAPQSRKYSTPLVAASTDVGFQSSSFRKRGRSSGGGSLGLHSQQPGMAMTTPPKSPMTTPKATRSMRARADSVDQRGRARDRFKSLGKSSTSPMPQRASTGRRSASAGPSRYRGSNRRAPHLDKEALRRTIREKLKSFAPKQEQHLAFMTVTYDTNASTDIISSLFPLKNEKDVSGGKYRQLAVASPVSLGRKITVLWHDVSPATNGGGKKAKSVPTPFKKPDVCLVIVDMKEHSLNKSYLGSLLAIPKANFAKRFAYKCGMVVVQNSVVVTKQLLACEEYDCPCKKFVATDTPSEFAGESLCAKCPHSRDSHMMEEEKALTMRKQKTIDTMRGKIRDISDGIVDALQTKGANARRSMRRAVSLSLKRKPVVKSVNVPVLESTDDACFNDKKRLASLWLHLFMGLDSDKLYAFYMATDLPEELSRGNLETILIRVSETGKK